MKWQPIETAPKDGTEILLYQRGWSRVVLGFRCSTGWCFADETKWVEAILADIWTLNEWRDDKSGPTHWMPLPEPPE